jgi:hypothetical protein
LFSTSTDPCGYCLARKDKCRIQNFRNHMPRLQFYPHDDMTVKTKLMIMAEKEDLPSSMGSESWCGICVTQSSQRGGMVSKPIRSSTDSIKISK